MKQEKKIKKVLYEFKSKMKEILGDNFRNLILFGSYARGEADEGSDIDLVIVVKTYPDKNTLRKIQDISNLFSLKNDIVISEFIFTEKEIKRCTPLFLNIRREGIWI